MIIATITLISSITGLVIFLGFKTWEDKTGGRRIFVRTRERMGRAIDEKIFHVQANFPRTAGRFTRLTTRIVRAYASFGAAKALISIEEMLERGLRHMRRAPRALERAGEASPFLREIAAYKRLLAREDGSAKEEGGEVEAESKSTK